MITVTGLTKRFGRTLVLDDLDFAVDDGEIAAVVGPSGAGKSTLARCLNLLERPSAGSVEVAGVELTTLRPGALREARRSIGTVFQSANLLSRLTVAQNVALPLEATTQTDAERYRRVHELLDRVGLLHRADHYPAQLSGGQRQRAGIARGLVLRPSVLLSDEATSGLDPEATASILRLVTELRDELGLTVVLITHEMDVVRSAADSVAFLDHGRIVEHGAVRDIVRGESVLSRALLPQPLAGDASVDQTFWELRYGLNAVDPAWLHAVSSELGSPVGLCGALVEQIGGVTVGRATVSVPTRLDADDVVAAFARRGLEVVRTDEAHPAPAVADTATDGRGSPDVDLATEARVA